MFSVSYQQSTVHLALYAHLTNNEIHTSTLVSQIPPDNLCFVQVSIESLVFPEVFGNLSK